MMPLYADAAWGGRFDMCMEILQGILRGHPLAIATARHGLDPRLVGQVPADCLANTGREGLTRIPPQLRLDLRRIHGVPLIVPGAVSDECDQLRMRYDRIIRPHFIEDHADRVHHVQILQLVSATDVISLANSAP